MSFGSILARPGFWLVCAPFSLGLFAQVALLTHQIYYVSPFLSEKGTAVCIGLTSLAAIVGRLLFGVLTDRIDPRFVAALNFAIQATGVFILLLLTSPSALYTGFALLGFGVGNMISLPGIILQREFAAEDFGRSVSLTIGIGQLVFAFGPVTVGLIVSTTHSFHAAFSLCLLLQLGSGLLVLAPRAKHLISHDKGVE